MHPALYFTKNQAGTSVYTDEDFLDENTKVLSCPFSLAIDFPTTHAALCSLLGIAIELTEREAICTYTVLHWCTRDTGEECVMPLSFCPF